MLVVLSVVEQRLDGVRAVLEGDDVVEVAASVRVHRSALHHEHVAAGAGDDKCCRQPGGATADDRCVVRCQAHQAEAACGGNQPTLLFLRNRSGMSIVDDTSAAIAAAIDQVGPGSNAGAAGFDTHVPHWFGSTGDQPAEILSIFAWPGERMSLRTTPPTGLAAIAPGAVTRRRPWSWQGGFVRTVWYERPGPAVPTEGELPDPVRAPGEVRIRLTRSGINPGDTKKRANRVGYGMPFRRIIPDSDAASALAPVRCAEPTRPRLVDKLLVSSRPRHQQPPVAVDPGLR